MGLIVNELTKKFGEKTAVDHLSFSMESPRPITEQVSLSANPREPTEQERLQP